jgi:hypothetical protein
LFIQGDNASFLKIATHLTLNTICVKEPKRVL